jgi:hypothetical protein
MMRKSQKNQIMDSSAADDSAIIAERLFDGDFLEAFSEGASVWLVRNRNQNLGALLNSDHREFYIQILHRMLHFRREHELEPLNEDIFLAVKTAVEKTASEEYTTTLFNRHIRQLTDWELLTERLEKERLRGYRDVRRDRFRYRLTDETVSFLHWLEDRLRGLDDDVVDDAGDILDFVLSRLRELGREVVRFDVDDLEPVDDDTARKAARITHLLYEVNERTDSISRNLTETSAKMESFLLLGGYSVAEAQEVIDELGSYLTSYLTLIHDLRRKILAELRKNEKDDRKNVLDVCFDIYSRELRKAPRFMRRSPPSETPDGIITRLSAYYRQHGRLDTLCDRVNRSAMKVWGKLSAHLRELERKNNRCEQIEKRIVEMAALPEQVVPVEFLRNFISSAAMTSDPNYWDEFTKADPPQPRFSSGTTKTTTRVYLPRKKDGSGTPVLSLEDARIKKLRQWIESKFDDSDLRSGVSIDSASFEGVKDFQKIMEISKRGLLTKGKTLSKIDLELKVEKSMVSVADNRCELFFRKSILKNRK